MSRPCARSMLLRIFVSTTLLGGCASRTVDRPIAVDPTCTLPAFLERGAGPIASAHRAGWKEIGLPENTLATLERAVAERGSIAEVDVREGRDGTLFLFHDARLSNDAWRFPSALRGASASSLSVDDLPHVCSSAHPGECLATLDRALETVEESCSVLQIDLKGPISDASLVRLGERITSLGLRERILFHCDPLEELRTVRRLLPWAQVIARVHAPSELEAALSLEPSLVQLDAPVLATELRSRVSEAGVGVLVKTLDELGDEPAHWRRLEQYGVDIVLTDYPRALRAELRPEG